MDGLSRDALFAIAINLELEELLRFCKASKHANELVCRQNDIWLYNIKQNFPTLDTFVMNKYRGNRSWKQYYIQDLYPTLKEDPNNLLLKSSKSGRLDLVIVALDLGANDIDDAFRYSSENGHLDVVKLLIDYGADIQADDNKTVIYSSGNGHLDVVKLLIDYGADIKAKDNMAIVVASRNGNYDLVKLLIDSGADVQAWNNESVIGAGDAGHLDVVKLLIDYGADIHAEDNLIVKLANKNGHYHVVDYLVSLGLPDPRSKGFINKILSYLYI